MSKHTLKTLISASLALLAGVALACCGLDGGGGGAEQCAPEENFCDGDVAHTCTTVGRSTEGINGIGSGRAEEQEDCTQSGQICVMVGEGTDAQSAFCAISREPCGTDFFTRCDGDDLLTCDSEEDGNYYLHRDTRCAETGQRCFTLPDNTAACLVSDEPCDEDRFESTCDGDRAINCQDGYPTVTETCDDATCEVGAFGAACTSN